MLKISLYEILSQLTYLRAQLNQQEHHTVQFIFFHLAFEFSVVGP